MMKVLATNRTRLVDATIRRPMTGATATITPLKSPNTVPPLLHRKLMEFMALHERMKSTTNDARLFHRTCSWRPPCGTLETGIDARRRRLGPILRGVRLPLTLTLISRRPWLTWRRPTLITTTPRATRIIRVHSRHRRLRRWLGRRRIGGHAHRRIRRHIWSLRSHLLGIGARGSGGKGEKRGRR